jgi:hypothetical protein
MKPEKLVELYNERAPSSLSSAEEIEQNIAYLLNMNLTGEQIFFSINYLSKYHPEDLRKKPEAVAWHWKEIKPYFELAKAKRLRDRAKESEVIYDQRNKYKRADTPSWFRKSFDQHLFK